MRWTTRQKRKFFFDASKYWRNFKTNLTRYLIMKYIDIFPELLKHPPLSYAEYIEQTMWDEFLAKRLTLEWEALRKLQQERRAKNIDMHKLSIMGYIGL